MAIFLFLPLFLIIFIIALKIVFALRASALLGYVQTACSSTVMLNGGWSRYGIYTAMSIERWCDSGSEVGVWKPWNVYTHPNLSICPIWDKTLSLLITLRLWFPSISLLFDCKSTMKRLFLLNIYIYIAPRVCFGFCFFFFQSESDTENEFPFAFRLNLMNFNNILYYGKLITTLSYRVGI